MGKNIRYNVFKKFCIQRNLHLFQTVMTTIRRVIGIVLRKIQECRSFILITWRNLIFKTRPESVFTKKIMCNNSKIVRHHAKRSSQKLLGQYRLTGRRGLFRLDFLPYLIKQTEIYHKTLMNLQNANRRWQEFNAKCLIQQKTTDNFTIIDEHIFLQF